jgi:murein DD-endopeptidase MepM/ murein hydrolase activator NlpD
LPFLASALAAGVTIIAALLPPLHTPGVPDPGKPALFPAPPGYLLPWPGGQIHTVTQGEETSFTHNGLAAYAFDFDLNYSTVVAARSGKVVMVKEDSNSGGCDPSYSPSTNYVVIDHGDGTSGVYMHLAYNAVLVKVGDIVEQGQPIAVSGETGLTCSDDDSSPAPHLHFQVEKTQDGHYYTQSLPIAFDDIDTNNGVPREGQSYVSGNFGSGQPQSVKLTPHHVPRVFNPKAKPANPNLAEGASNPDTPTPQPTMTPEASETPTPEASGTATEEPTATETPQPSDTPQPTDTPASTSTAAPTDTPVPATDTPSPPTATPPPPSPTPPPAPSATAGTTPTALRPGAIDVPMPIA